MKRTQANLILASTVVLTMACSEQPAAPKPMESSTPTQANELDLSRQHLEGVIDHSEVATTEQALLPDMFESSDKVRRVKVDGSLITNEEAITLEDKIEGVEFKIEVATP